jgi:hypothetical protein
VKSPWLNRKTAAVDRKTGRLFGGNGTGEPTSVVERDPQVLYPAPVSGTGSIARAAQPVQSFVLQSAIGATGGTSRRKKSSLRNFAKGILAHLVIQTVYRVQHQGNLIITERSVWVGDAKASTISRTADELKKLRELVRKALDQRSAGKGSSVDVTIDLLTVLVYLIDESTVEAGVMSPRKRFDIVDFGPPVLSHGPQLRYGETYEIKSRDGARQGRDYVTKQTDRYNATLESTHKELEAAFGVAGLRGYYLRPGGQWPPARERLPVGSNALEFWFQEPGVICYEWTTFNRVIWEQLWKYARQAQEAARRAFRTEWHLNEDVVVFLWIVGIVAVGLLGLAIAGAGAVAGVGGLAKLLGLTTLGAAGAAAADERAEIRGVSDSEIRRLEEVQAALEKMEDLELRFGQDAQRRPLQPGDYLPGGVEVESPYDKALYQIVDTLVSATVLLYRVELGHGRSDYDEESFENLRHNLFILLGGFIEVYGLDNFMVLTGRNHSGPLDEVTAQEIAAIILAAGKGNLESTAYGRFIETFLALADDDVNACLPEGYDDDGE